MIDGRRKLAVVLFNLGGPDGPHAVRPFLKRLFSDPAIIKAPTIVRLPLATLISRLRERSAIANYALMGGGSPILGETQEQAAALEAVFAGRRPDLLVKAFIAMRYSEPSTVAAANAIRGFNPDEVVLAPLYPQFSTTTTGSSFDAWRAAYGETAHGICCWFENPGLISAHCQLIKKVWEGAGRPKVRLLFSAHGLPESIAASGDPYQWQVERSCARIGDELGPGWDWSICYQSRVGPMKWIGPSTPEAIRTAGSDRVGVLIDPIAFVSEHIETLVELDRDYAELAAAAGVPVYLRVPAVGVNPLFIGGLADAIEQSLCRTGVNPDTLNCPHNLGRCLGKGQISAL